MITYCTNIHPGESWDEIFSNLDTYIPGVKEAVSPKEPFPIGLRLSRLAAETLLEGASNGFFEWCLDKDCFVPTINGFPYGPFHSVRTKEKVYTPDWRQKERADFTKILAALLDSWLPDRMTGSISTVPAGFKKHVSGDDYEAIRKNLIDVLECLDGLRQKSGKEIILSLEPEPGCLLETSSDVVRFLEEMRFPEELVKGIGICFDCCHQAVEFEDPAESIGFLLDAGVRIGKVQVSSALRMKDFPRERLESFCEPCYLHQVVIRRNDGSLVRYDDLDEALVRHRGSKEEEWRVHFHLPVYAGAMDGCGTTRGFAEDVIHLVDRKILLEVETYTWQALPPEFRTETVSQAIIREISWVSAQAYETNSGN